MRYDLLAIYARGACLALDSYLLHRQDRHIQRLQSYDLKSSHTQRKEIKYALVSLTLQQAVKIGFILSQGNKRLWEWTVQLVAPIGGGFLGYVGKGVAFWVLFKLTEQAISFPALTYHRFAILRSPITARNARLWIMVTGFGSLIDISTAAAKATLVMTAGWLIGERRLVQVLIGVLYIGPLITIIPGLFPYFYDVKGPLPDGELRTQVEVMTSKIGFPLSNLYVIDSRDGPYQGFNHHLAMCLGFWRTKYILISETLLEADTVEEVIATIAHELGHWYHDHSTKAYFFKLPYAFLLLGFLYFGADPQLFSSFGLDTILFSSPIEPGVSGQRYPLTLAFFLYSISVESAVRPIWNLVRNCLTQSQEHQADRFAAKLGYAAPLSSTLRKARDNDKNYKPLDRLYNLFFESHPEVDIRIQALEEMDR
ncbi:peptidase family M48-domain-containing protein [Naematelia encephala]|uniref:Peptidase family M48-domain-containing protein n=1 Tax=Naematelia encephala TaxID=71784 RepID=A0A1Y2APG3_9TREE|nr:peptidase family M48-domain-containing protein [Naematelia encephala]